MRVTSTATVMPPPGHRKAGAPPSVTRVSPLATERVRSTGFSVTPARSDPPAPAMNRTEQSHGPDRAGHDRRHRAQILVEDAVERIFAGGRGQEQAQAGPSHGGVDLLDDRERV